MRYNNDKRIVMTLDAGGTNFVFSAIQGEKEIIEPFSLPAAANSLEEVLLSIKTGFNRIKQSLDASPVAISFSFPGPADYEAGIIGNLENLPVFKGGVALGPYLEDTFALPVFINNDGDLFAYGEAIAGLLPAMNDLLEKSGSPKRYKNLLGVTFGTGFGGGIVYRGKLLHGDNSAPGEINRSSNKLYPGHSAEESISIRGIKRVFAREASIPTEESPEPKDIFEIGMGTKPGNKHAAIKAFEELAIVAGNSIADAVTLIDGLVVLGGGLSGAHPLFLSKLVQEMNAPFKTIAGRPLDRLEIKAYNLHDNDELTSFVKGEVSEITVPFGNKAIKYDPVKRIGVGISSLGTSKAVSIGAYAYALNRLDLK